MSGVICKDKCLVLSIARMGAVTKWEGEQKKNLQYWGKLTGKRGRSYLRWPLIVKSSPIWCITPREVKVCKTRLVCMGDTLVGEEEGGNRSPGRKPTNGPTLEKYGSGQTVTWRMVFRRGKPHSGPESGQVEVVIRDIVLRTNHQTYIHKNQLVVYLLNFNFWHSDLKLMNMGVEYQEMVQKTSKT